LSITKKNPLHETNLSAQFHTAFGFCAEIGVRPHPSFMATASIVIKVLLMPILVGDGFALFLAGGV